MSDLETILQQITASEPLDIMVTAFGQSTAAPEPFAFLPSQCQKGEGLGSNNLCAACSRGHYSPDKSITACIACPAGKYQNASSAVHCNVTSAGFFQQRTGATGQEPCPRGTFSDSTMSESCSECLAGQFADATGSTTCTRCSAGSTKSTRLNPAGRSTSRTGM